MNRQIQSSDRTFLGCERLESREVPAGNVIAFLRGPDLIVAGDAANNLFSIQQNGNGDLVIHGVAGTTINGQSSVFLGRGVLNNVFVDSGAGQDLVEMIGVNAGGIGVALGHENDGVALYGVMCGALQLLGQGGDDIFVTDGVWVAQWAELHGGPGNDIIDFRSLGIWTNGFIAFPSIERVA